ncbi:MAG: CHAP domain-containing protein, partial [Alphaproteobacteria bacterium]|nr:CHAP domain-containing protein [Alphaproteobacteria bacterium]
MAKGKALTYQTSGGSALCSASAQYYKNNGAWFNYPEPGDQIFFYYGGAINHTGIVESVQGSGANWTSCTTIEGNSSDMVARRTYYRGNGAVAGFGRPNWKVVADGSGSSDSSSSADVFPTPIPTMVVTHYGERSDAVKDLQEKLIKLGYDVGRDGADGQFGL